MRSFFLRKMVTQSHSTLTDIARCWKKYCQKLKDLVRLKLDGIEDGSCRTDLLSQVTASRQEVTASCHRSRRSIILLREIIGSDTSM